MPYRPSDDTTPEQVLKWLERHPEDVEKLQRNPGTDPASLLPIVSKPLSQKKAEYYRNERPDLDPQSNWSRVLEFFGQDEPYRNDSGSYDYRQKKFDADRNDPSWWFPELPDDVRRDVGVGLERGLGNWNPAPIMAAVRGEPFQYIQQMDDPSAPVDLDPFPESWKGTKEREGNQAPGALAHALEQFEWLSPYSAKSILSVVGPDSEATVQRDIDSWKGGPSSLDRTLGGLFNLPEPSPDEYQPGYKGSNRERAVDAVEWASLSPLIPFGAIASAGRKAVSGGQKAVGLAQKAGRVVYGRARGKASPPPNPVAKPLPTKPQPPKKEPPGTVAIVPGTPPRGVRDDIYAAILDSAKRRKK